MTVNLNNPHVQTFGNKDGFSNYNFNSETATFQNQSGFANQNTYVNNGQTSSIYTNPALLQKIS